MPSPMRRLASANVQKTNAAQMATRKRTRSLTARFSPSFEIPKMASGVIEGLQSIGTVREKTQKRLRVGLSRLSQGSLRLSQPLKEDPAQQVSDAEEDEDHRGHHEGHEADHREEAGAAVVHQVVVGAAISEPGYA